MEKFAQEFSGPGSPALHYFFLRFDHIPSDRERVALGGAGVRLLDYIPINVYVAEIRAVSAGMAGFLRRQGVLAFRELGPVQKIAPDLAADRGGRPGGVGWQDLRVLFFPSVPFDSVISRLAAAGYPLQAQARVPVPMAMIRCRQDDLAALAALPFVKYIERPAPSPDAGPHRKYDSRDEERGNILQAGLPGGYHLTGEGVPVGIFEFFSPPQQHIDFTDRLVPMMAWTGLDQAHATHVTGIVGSAGNLNELYTGYAPNALLYVAQQPMPKIPPPELLLTNNSYPTGASCTKAGLGYTALILDQLSLDRPALLHVFAAGNSAADPCQPFPPGYHTILDGDQSAKSSIAVGSLTPEGVWSNTSSQGPTADGRIKPEIMATGFTISTWPGNTYAYDGGTSMAAPAVTGGLALLYEEYHRLHHGEHPGNALMKAIICNTATDLGNPGPDFRFGFGQMNLLRAVQAVDSSRWFTGVAGTGNVNTHTITVAPHTAQLKVMLYWQDIPCSIFAGPALVNDLDLEVIGPDGTHTLPYVLDTIPANVALPATRGEDHVNNIEQVVIDHPIPGTYQCKVRVHAMPQGGTQAYVTTFDAVPTGVQLTFPYGGAKLLPGESTTIRWDSWGDSTAGSNLLFSSDSGLHWQPVATVSDPGQRQLSWTVPALATDSALMKLVRSGDGASSITGPFVIADAPAIALSPDQCPGSIALRWQTVPGVTGYEVMILRNGHMQPLAAITDTFYTIRNLAIDSLYWVTVRSLVHGVAGRRAVALSRMPSDGSCADPNNQNDLAADSLISPITGRKYTSTMPGSHDSIRLRVRNVSGQPIGHYTVQYRVNEGSWISETVVSPLAAGAVDIHVFSIPFDFSAAGVYNLTLVVTAPGDPNPGNDTLHDRLRILDNIPVATGSEVMDDFSHSPDTVYGQACAGIAGADRFDYAVSGASARLQTNPGYPTDSSHHSIQLDYPFDYPAGQLAVLTATYNLSQFDTAYNTIGMSFNFARSSYWQPGDMLSVRGADTLPWIDVLPLSGLMAAAGHVQVADIAPRLRAAGQNFSSSFQVRWLRNAGPASSAFDSIRLFGETIDLALLHIDSLPYNGRGLGQSTAIHITVRNNGRQPYSRVPAYYQADGKSRVYDTIPLLMPGDSIAFTFSVPADLSAPGLHHLEAGIVLPADQRQDNNVKTIAFHNQPLITQYPYLENFEAGDGSWYVDGINSSWAYGRPASPLINSAASGVRAWKTNLTGNFNQYEIDYIYSPYFDLSTLKDPTISLSVALNTDSCGVPNSCDYLAVQYSPDNGATWRPLVLGERYNWTTYLASLTNHRWHVATNQLPATNGIIQFRMQFHSNGFNAHEGAALDDIHIYDGSQPIYDNAAGGTLSVSADLTAGGTGWVDLAADGQLLAQINSNGQDPGQVTVQTFLHSGAAVRHFHGQYYLDRNWVMLASHQKFTQPVGVRLYFTDAEANALVLAANCPVCTQPGDAYRLGVSQYSTDSSREENDSISDDINGSWAFFDSTKVRIVPYGRGYYIEFQTDHLSEFRLNSGGLDQESWLPVRVTGFSAAVASASQAHIRWTTASEIDMHHFAILRAIGTEAMQAGRFDSVGFVSATGYSIQSHDYRFSDQDSSLRGKVYYRLKAVDSYGHAAYSLAKPVSFTGIRAWQVWPNPSTGHFTLQYQLGNGEEADMILYNTSGMVLGRLKLTGTGFMQNLELDLAGAVYPAGVYFLKILSSQPRVMKLVKLEK